MTPDKKSHEKHNESLLSTNFDFTSELKKILNPSEPVVKLQEERKKEMIKIIMDFLNLDYKMHNLFKINDLINKFNQKFNKVFNNETSYEEKTAMKNFILKIRENKLNEVYFEILNQVKWKNDIELIVKFIKNYIENFLKKETWIYDEKFDFSQESIMLMNYIKTDFKKNNFNTIKKLLDTTSHWNYWSIDQKPWEIVVSLFHWSDMLAKSRIGPIKNGIYELKEISPNHIIIAGKFINKNNNIKKYDFFEVKTRFAWDKWWNYYDNYWISKSSKK